MLEFTPAQWARLAALEHAQYLDGLRNLVVAVEPALASDATLRPRLEQAHRHAAALGFTDGAAITQFVYYESISPGFYRELAVDRWLRKPGASVESRWHALRQVVRHKGA